jgi:hypothetical protein
MEFSIFAQSSLSSKIWANAVDAWKKMKSMQARIRRMRETLILCNAI